MFTMTAADASRIPEWFNAVTGWDTNWDELMKVGERIANLRMAFTVREGLNPTQWHLPGRVVGQPGEPAFEEGPHKGFILDIETMRKEFLEIMEWDPQTSKPSRQKLVELGLADVAAALYSSGG